MMTTRIRIQTARPAIPVNDRRASLTMQAALQGAFLADVRALRSLDQPVSAHEDGLRHRNADRLRDLEIDRQVEALGLIHRDVCRLFSLQNPAHQRADPAKNVDRVNGQAHYAVWLIRCQREHRNSEFEGEFSDPWMVDAEKDLVWNKQRAQFPRGHSGDSALQLLGLVYRNDRCLEPQGSGRPADARDNIALHRILAVNNDADPFRRRQRRSYQLEHLAFQTCFTAGRGAGHAGDRSAWPAIARNEAGADRVPGGRKN